MRRTRGSRSFATSESRCVRRPRMSLLGGLDVRGGHGDGAIAEIALDDAIGEGVDEPGLALGKVVDERGGLRLEALPRDRGVLREELEDLFALVKGPSSWASAETLKGDWVPSHRRGEAILLGEDVRARGPEPDERDAVREGRLAATEIALAELGHERDHRGPDEAVGFVDQDDEREGA